MKQTIFRYGFLYALTLCIGFFASYLVLGDNPDNYTKSEVVGYSIMLFTSVIVVLAIRDASKRLMDFGFVKGLCIGLGVSAIGAFAFAIYNWLYVSFIHPEFLDDYVAYHQTAVQQSGASDAIVQRQLAELAAYQDMMSNPVILGALMFMTVFFIGALFGLCAALVYKSKK